MFGIWQHAFHARLVKETAKRAGLTLLFTLQLFFSELLAIVRYTDRYHQDHAATRAKLDTIKASTIFFFAIADFLICSGFPSLSLWRLTISLWLAWILDKAFFPEELHSVLDPKAVKSTISSLWSFWIFHHEHQLDVHITDLFCRPHSFWYDRAQGFQADCGSRQD